MAEKVLIIGNSPILLEISNYLKENPEIGYSVENQPYDYLEKLDPKKTREILDKNKIQLVVIDVNIKKESQNAKILYSLILMGIECTDSREFYEKLFGKIPISEVEEGWFIEKVTNRTYPFNTIKRGIDLMLAVTFSLILIPITILVILLIKITSPGPIIYKQERVGKNNKLFVLYKFRTMVKKHDGPLWTTEKDNRLTPIGKILRKTHLDEIPQLLNMIKNDISFIGPRPERTELVNMYEKIPYYEIRHTVKPGLTGWAQIYYKPSVSVEEAQKKLEYDLYYIKNRSLILDFIIVFKTIKHLFMSH